MREIDELREWGQQHKGWHLFDFQIAALADAIEQAIADRYMELPLDIDGVPIRVGDTIEYPNGRRDVVRFITVNDNMPTFNELGWVASKCRHVKSETIEDVLREFEAEVESCNNTHETARRYAELIERMVRDA